MPVVVIFIYIAMLDILKNKISADTLAIFTGLCLIALAISCKDFIVKVERSDK